LTPTELVDGFGQQLNHCVGKSAQRRANQGSFPYTDRIIGKGCVSRWVAEIDGTIRRVPIAIQFDGIAEVMRINILREEAS